MALLIPTCRTKPEILVAIPARCLLLTEVVSRKAPFRSSKAVMAAIYQASIMRQVLLWSSLFAILLSSFTRTLRGRDPPFTAETREAKRQVSHCSRVAELVGGRAGLRTDLPSPSSLIPCPTNLRFKPTSTLYFLVSTFPMRQTLQGA